MVHLEDLHQYDPADARGFAKLATMVTAAAGAHGNPRGAKMSWQFDVTYFDPAEYPDPLPNPPTSLRMLLENGHNWWVHNHSTTYDHLTTTWNRIASAYTDERPGALEAADEVIGRSGGWDLDAPVDWVSITEAKGLKVMNSVIQASYDYTPRSLRPMQYTAEQIEALHFHERAPGNTNEGVPSTMQQRPFWMDTASRFDLKLDTIYPEYTGSILMLPKPSNFALHKLAQGRSAFDVDTLTQADLKAALTQVWTTYETMNLYLNSITNVWYIHLQPQYCQTAHHDMIAEWVDSINELMDVFGATPKGSWHNMNEIASLASHPTSKYH